MRIPAGAAVVEPWLNSEECLECLKSRGSITHILLEPVLALTSVFRAKEPLAERVLIVLGQGSYLVPDPSHAADCACTYFYIEKDAWGSAEEAPAGDA